MLNMKRLNKKGQASLEMCIIAPIFMILMLACFDLVTVQSVLMNTMTITRNTLRSMTLAKAHKDGHEALVYACNEEEKLATDRFFANYESYPKCKGVDRVTPGKTVSTRGLKREGNGFSKTYEDENGKLHMSSGGGALNNPHIVQICSKFTPFFPAIWQKAKNGKMDICTSYFTVRQYQDYS